MAIEEFLALLEREANIEADGLLAEARAEAARRVGAADSEAAQRQTAFLDRTAAELKRETDHLLAAAEHAAREEVLRVRTALLEKVFAEVEKTLDDLSVDEYAEAVPTLVETALAFLPEEGATLRCRPDAVPAVRCAVGDAGHVRVVEDDTVAAGVLGQADDGSVTVDNTLSQHLGRLRDEIAIAVISRIDSTEGRLQKGSPRVVG